MYTAHILRATGNQRLPQGEWDSKVLLPSVRAGEVSSISPKLPPFAKYFLSTLPKLLQTP
jgi:hypothetical protein